MTKTILARGYYHVIVQTVAMLDNSDYKRGSNPQPKATTKTTIAKNIIILNIDWKSPTPPLSASGDVCLRHSTRQRERISTKHTYYQGLQYQYQYQYQKSILGPSIPIPIPILSKFWPSIPIPIPRPLNTNTRGLNTTKVVLNLNFSNSALQIFEADFTKIKNIFRFYFILLDFKTKFYFGKLIFFAF